MSQFYCHNCAEAMGYLKPVDTNINLTGSSYQLSKFYRHTLPPNTNDLISIFDSSDYNDYREYVLNTAASGSVEIDSKNRMNVVWVAGKHTGFTFQNGVSKIPNDAVKVVLHTDENKIHAYPTGSIGFSIAQCIICGRDIIT